MAGKEGTRNIPGLPKRSALDYFSSLEIESARLAAEKLLDDIENRRGDVDAYQLFEEGKEYSASQIGKIFDKAAWPNLGSRNSAAALMEELKDKFGAISDHFCRQSPEGARQADEDIAGALFTLFELGEQHRAVYPKLLSQLSAFALQIKNDRIFSTREESYGQWTEVESFIDWCFTKNHKGNSYFRAHEIFRYAKIMGWNQESLQQPLADLGNNCFPNPKVHPSALKRFRLFEERPLTISEVGKWWPENTDQSQESE